jgi:hypothetical protein
MLIHGIYETIEIVNLCSLSNMILYEVLKMKWGCMSRMGGGGRCELEDN